MPGLLELIIGAGIILAAIIAIILVLSILASLSTILQCVAADRKDLRARNESKHRRFLNNPQAWREDH